MRDVARPEDPDRRLLSLDVFRGITVAAMVLVNNPGTWRAVYGPLRHADWHGWTPTDLIFPFFLFIVGVAIPFGLGRRLDADHGRGQVVRKVLRRALVIFLLGLVLHAISSMDLATIRIPGVLQRIAVCYLVASLVFLTFGRGAPLLIATIALFGYWAALTLIPVPGFGAGDLSKEGNLAAWIDRSVLGAHIWRVGRVYDPEGILSTIPAIATTLLGVLTGQWLRGARVSGTAAGRLLLAGVVGVVTGALPYPRRQRPRRLLSLHAARDTPCQGLHPGHRRSTPLAPGNPVRWALRPLGCPGRRLPGLGRHECSALARDSVAVLPQGSTPHRLTRVVLLRRRAPFRAL